MHLSAFYQQVTDEAWGLAPQVEAMEKSDRRSEIGGDAAAQPGEAAIRLRRFQSLRSRRRGPEAERDRQALRVRAVLPVGGGGAPRAPRDPQIALTEAGWDLIRIFDGIDFSLPHPEEMGSDFLDYLRVHAAADHWGFRTPWRGRPARGGWPGGDERALP